MAYRFAVLVLPCRCSRLYGCLLGPHRSTLKTARQALRPLGRCLTSYFGTSADLGPAVDLFRFPVPLLLTPLLLARQAQLAEGAREGHEAARGAEVRAALLERGIGPLPDERAEPPEVL